MMPTVPPPASPWPVDPPRAPQQSFDDRDGEREQVFAWRYCNARAAGLDHDEAKVFARSQHDIGQLRKLAKSGCPPALLARIMV